MTGLYTEFYKEILDSNGDIKDISFSYGRNFNFAYDIVDRYALEEPEKIALIHKSTDGKVRKFSFAELKRLSDKAANMLIDLGIGKKDSVMLLLKRRFEFWICILALHKLGAVAIPTSHMVSATDIAERLVLSGAKAVICVNSDDICHKVSDAIKDAEDKAKDKEKIEQIVVGEKFNSALMFDKLLEKASDKLLRVETSVDNDMLYYFTSGTNGAPKAVIHDYSYPLSHIYTAKNWHGASCDGVHLTVADSGWAKSAWGKLYGQWLVGTAVLVYDYEQFYAWDILQLLQEEKVTSFCAPPTIYKYLVLEDFSKYDLSSLKQVTTAGEPMPIEVSQKFTEKTGLIIREGFGQTETALLICTPVGKEQISGSIGLASPLYDIRLVDEAGKEVPDGSEGEIVIFPKDKSKKPLGIFKGYLGDETLYQEIWDGGIYHTRDRAIKDKDGNIFFLGRNDDVIKSSGYRIGPSEVEDVIMLHPAVFECAVTGFPSKNRGTLVKASIILNKEYEPSQQLSNEIQDFVRERVALYKYPRKICFVKELPRTTNGKISRAQIRKMDYHQK
ncbi:AMP-binding protein [Butyrivibrio sp. INlla14]|uniref:AMP-binding protein n=1 Tax=Butyrivibrio sp. INlla14 TaxID=1520808 RepID=UPI000875FB27|nr:AMP-binding protein [Butyrivibrio sp. INlla14]SCY31603.1 acetyl-CoA synthetase [Butyrivibrio sp. INlla14]